MVQAVPSAGFRLLTSVQTGLFLVALVVLTLEPNAERSFFEGAGDPRGCDVASIVQAPDAQVEQHDGNQAVLLDLIVVATMPAKAMQPLIVQPLMESTQSTSFRSQFITSIWCSSDL
jgi:hypothetical protein